MAHLEGNVLAIELFPASTLAAPPKVAEADRVWTPKVGLHGLVLGKSTEQDVLAAYGAERARVMNVRDTGSVDYFGGTSTYLLGGEGALTRPMRFGFQKGVLTSIKLTAFQKELKSATGLGIVSTPAEFEAAYGPGVPGKDVVIGGVAAAQTMSFPAQGITITYSERKLQGIELALVQ